MSRTFSALPEWLRQYSDGSNRPMVHIIPHCNQLEELGYEYPFHDVPVEDRVYLRD